MNIDGMNVLEKSVMLARLCGWSIVEFMQHHDYRLMDASDNEIKSLPDWYQTDGDMLDFYDPDNMALAWRVLNWGMGQGYPMGDAIAESLTEGPGFYGVFEMPPADAQRAWLDKILALAIEAGMVTE